MPFDIDSCYKLIQNYLKETPLILVGSGNSCACGIPGMSGIAQELISKLDSDYSTDTQWQKFKQNIQSGLDLEAALVNVDCCPDLIQSICKCIWEYITKYDLDLFRKIAHRTTDIGMGDLLKYLMETHPQKINVITTNYDRVIEYGCDLYDVEVDTYSKGMYKQHLDVNSDHRARVVKLLKIHGSLDWFEDERGRTISIPLQSEIPDGMIPKIISPGDLKYRKILVGTPYRDILGEMDRLIKQASCYLCIGYGFNDEQIQELIFMEAEKGKPIVIVTKKLLDSPKQKVISHAKNYIIIEQDDVLTFSSISTNEGNIKIEDELWSVVGLTNRILY